MNASAKAAAICWFGGFWTGVALAALLGTLGFVPLWVVIVAAVLTTAIGVYRLAVFPRLP